MEQNNLKTRDKIIALIATITLIAMSITISLNQKGYFKEKQTGAYNLKDVAVHNKVDDCWIIVDGKVFNMTEASKGHPSMFTCGGDGSANYHKIMVLLFVVAWIHFLLENLMMSL